MRAGCHQMADGRESFEVVLLARKERVLLEVRHDTLEDVLEPACLPLERLVAPIGSDASAAEERFDRMKDLGPISVLTDREARPHLPSRAECLPRSDGN